MVERIKRINTLLRRELMALITDRMRDPRLEFLTVHRVETTRDLQKSKVYCSSLHTEYKKDILNILNRSAGFFRHELGLVIRIKRIPELVFVWDDTTEKMERIETLLDQED